MLFRVSARAGWFLTVVNSQFAGDAFARHLRSSTWTLQLQLATRSLIREQPPSSYLIQAPSRSYLPPKYPGKCLLSICVAIFWSIWGSAFNVCEHFRLKIAKNYSTRLIANNREFFAAFAFWWNWLPLVFLSLCAIFIWKFKTFIENYSTRLIANNREFFAAFIFW